MFTWVRRYGRIDGTGMIEDHHRLNYNYAIDIRARWKKKKRTESKPEARWLLTLCHAIASCTKSNQIIERAKWKRHPCGSHVKISRAHGIQHEKIQCTTVGSECKIIQIINSGSGNYLHCGGCGTADDAGNIVYAARSLFINNKSITGIYIIQKIQMKREIERHRASHTHQSRSKCEMENNIKIDGDARTWARWVRDRVAYMPKKKATNITAKCSHGTWAACTTTTAQHMSRPSHTQHTARSDSER